MNIKKLSAALFAAAMMVTSGSAAVRSVAADSSDIVMVSLREYKTQLTINDKTYSELADGVTIGDILDGMVYKGNQTDKDGNSFTDGAPVTIPVDATVVWVGNNKYSIYDRDTKVHLSSYGANDIIIGSGKQLDPNNVIYHVYASIRYVTFDIDWDNSDIKLYSIASDGTEKLLDYKTGYTYDSSLSLTVQSKKNNDKVMADISGLRVKRSDGKAMPEYTLKLYGSSSDYWVGKEILPDDKGRKLISLDSYRSSFYYSLFSKDGTSLPGASGYYSEDIRVSYPEIFIWGYLGNSSIYTSDFISQEGTNSITYEYTEKLSPGTSAEGLKFRISSFSNDKSFESNGDIKKSVKGNRTDFVAAADDEDITNDLFDYYGGVDGDYVNGQEFTIFLKGDSENVKLLLDTEDAKEYIVHIKITAVEQRLYTDLVYESGAVGENVSSGYYRYSEVKSSNGFSRTDYIGVPASMQDSSVGYYISKLQRKYDKIDLKDKVTKAVKGKFTSSESAVDAEEISIADLFDSSKGYVSDFSTENGEDITIFLDAAGDSPANALCEDENATEYVINIHIDKYIYTPMPEPEPEPEPEFVDTDDSKLPPDIKNTNFKVLSVSDERYNVIKTFLGLHTDSEATYFDTYGKYGMQTIFVFDDENGGTIDLSKIRLNVKTDTDVRVFLIEDGKATYVNLDEETQDFSDGKVKHYATAKRGEGNKYYKQGNYYVTVKKGNNSSGNGLFVEGPSDQNGQQGGTRTIFFDSYYGKAYHDIVIANLGTSPLTNLTAILSDAKNIKLNGFWDLNGEYQLAPTTVSVTGNGMSKVTRVENMAKIRIEPETDENGRPKKGDIEGTLILLRQLNVSKRRSHKPKNSRKSDAAVLYVLQGALTQRFSV